MQRARIFAVNLMAVVGPPQSGRPNRPDLGEPSAVHQRLGFHGNREKSQKKYFSSKKVFPPETSRNGTKCIRMHSKRVLVAPFGFGKKNEKRIDRSYEFRSFEDRHRPPRIIADLASLAAPHWGGPTTAMTFYREKRQKFACAAHTRSSGRTMRVSTLAMWDIFWSHGIPGVDTMCEHHPCPVPGLVFFALSGSSWRFWAVSGLFQAVSGCFRLFWLFVAVLGCVSV